MAFPFTANTKRAHSWSRTTQTIKSVGRMLQKPLEGLRKLPLTRALNQAQKSRFVFEGLEPRLLFAADLALIAAGGDHTLKLSDDLTMLELVLDSDLSVVASVALDTTVTVTGTANNDTLTLDTSLGNEGS